MRFKVRERKPGKRQRRASAGDPSCEACREAAAGYCPEHTDYHAETDPLAGIG